jgi:CDP-glucose 4,6-dehydratase
MVRAVIELWGTGEYRIDDLPEEPYEEKSLFMDCEKAATLLGWRPLFDLAYGLPDTVSWYRTYFQNKDGGDLVEYSVSRIRSAMQRIETLSHPCA